MNYISKYTGEAIDSLLESIDFTPIENVNLNDINEPGIYGIQNGTVASNIGGKPEGFLNAGAVLIVLRFNTSNNRIQILIPNYDAGFYWRTKAGVNWAYWKMTSAYKTEFKKIGTSAQRPSFPENQKDYYIGVCYIDTSLNKPIWWTGDTSDGKSGWVDATGTSA